ncbi:MAG: dienelactone hydrolase family protein [Aquificae bacterium]|nr:dienelactone hydrolase family protein [Aquificota bacterium]
MSGKTVEFEKDGVKVKGYLALPCWRGPAVLVMHEWWGLESPLSNVQEICDRFAEEGFVAFAPDFYEGKSADNPDDAGRLMTEMFERRLDRVRELFKASVAFLKECRYTEPKKVGITGFCCGGTLAMLFAAEFPELIDASVPFYGLPQLAPIDASKIRVPVYFVLAEKDEFVNNDEVLDMVKAVWKNGVEAAARVFPGVSHAFLNEKRPEVFNARKAEEAFRSAVAFFKYHLS